jgi:hypothetical protein
MNRTEQVTAAPGRIVIFPPSSENPGLTLYGRDVEGYEPSPPTAIEVGSFERRRINAGDLLVVGAPDRAPTNTQNTARVHTAERK